MSRATDAGSAALMLVLALLLHGSNAGAGEAFLHGTVSVDGAWPKVGLSLRADTGDRLMHTEFARKDGSFEFRLPVVPGAEVMLMPNNLTALDTNEPVFITGYLKTKATDGEGVKVKLKARRILARDVQVLDEDGAPAAKIYVGMHAAVPLGPEPGAPQWKDYVSFETDGRGRFGLKYVEQEEGAYNLTVSTMDAAGDRFEGRAAFSAKQLMTGDEPLTFTVKRSKVWLEARFTWDPDCGEKAFEPDIGSADGAHFVALSGHPRQKALMDSHGLARFYDLKPGSYTIELSEQGRRLYRISRGAERVAIPEGAEPPVRHVVTLQPADKRVIFGTVVDLGTREPVAGALVSIEGAGAIKTGPDGKFALQGFPGLNIKLHAEHPDYHDHDGVYMPPASEGKPDASGLVVRLTPLPLMEVRVLDRDTGDGVPGCRVYAEGKVYKKTLTSEAGDCKFRLPDGPYRLRVRRPGTPVEGDAAGARHASRAMVYLGEMAVPKEGGKLRVEVPAVAAVRVLVKGLGPDRQDKRPGFCLVRPEDDFIMAGAPVNAQGEGIAYVGAGTYRLVVVAEDEKLGVDGGEVKAVAPVTGPIRVEVREWRKLNMPGDGRLTLGEAAEGQK